MYYYRFLAPDNLFYCAILIDGRIQVSDGWENPMERLGYIKAMYPGIVEVDVLTFMKLAEDSAHYVDCG
jgi:hypothetical protein